MSDTSNNNVLSVNYKDKSELYAAYMPYLKQGGLFIATNEEFKMNDEVFVVLSMMDQPEKFHIQGHVSWITPPGAQGGLRAGIGIHLDNDANQDVRNKIETFLVGSLTSDKRTDTM